MDRRNDNDTWKPEIERTLPIQMSAEFIEKLEACMGSIKTFFLQSSRQILPSDSRHIT